MDFVQIGANDGVRNDPLCALVKKHQLPGLFVEPLPDMFERLKANYAGCVGLRYERGAIAQYDGEAALYRVRPDAPLPDWTHGLASFDRSHISGSRFGVRGIESHVETLVVPAMTIQTLFAKHGIEQPALLQVDTEGFDCEIVRMALEAGIQPAVINYEFCHATPNDRRRCKELLCDNGYCFVDFGRDTLAIREDHLAS